MKIDVHTAYRDLRGWHTPWKGRDTSRYKQSKWERRTLQARQLRGLSYYLMRRGQ